jgi:hypothetical protein
MSDHLFKVRFVRDDIAVSGLGAGEGAAYPLEQAVKLVAAGVCRIDDSEPQREQLEAAVKAYKPPALNPLWLLPAVTRRWPGWDQ